MRLLARPGLVAVATRELRWVRRDRVALFLLAGVPLIAFAFLALTFSSAVVRGLGVAVIDADRSPTSTIFVQAIEAAPGVSIALRSDDLSAATRAIRAGDALAAAYIPRNFERDLIAGRRPQIIVFYNQQYYTPGNVASRGLTSALSAAASAIKPFEGIKTQPISAGPLVVEQYVLTNPATNYAQFLLRALLPMVLHVVIAVATGFSVGSEFSRRNLRAWLRCAGDRPLVALLGKLAPLTGIFMLLMVVVLIILDGLFQLPFRGDALMIGVAAFLLVVAYQGLGALIQLLIRRLPVGLSLTGIVCSPAFGYAGVGFPVIAMGTFPQIWGSLLPLRWYIQILFDQAARGSPVHDSALPFATLGGMATLLFALSWLRLTSLARRGHGGARKAEPEVEGAAMPGGRGIAGAFAAEWRRVLADSSVFSLFVLAPLLYGIFYPQPYLGELLRDAPIAVVDHDHSELSRSLIQTLDAHEAIKVAVRTDTLAEAQQALFGRKVFAILDIPVDTEREVLKGNPARLPAYVDATYFIAFNRTLQGIAESASVTTSEFLTHGARPDGSIVRFGLAALSPVDLRTEPLFNPTGGYAAYVVPAAFVLIIQQTLLMGAAMLGGVAYETGGVAARRRRGGPGAVLGQALAHLCFYVPALGLYLVILPRVYGFSTLGKPLDLLVFAVPVILATSFLGQAAGVWFKHRETAVLLFIATSLPQFFLVGVSWPAEAVPPLLRNIGRIFPSESAIDGLVRINQMGASLHEVARDWGVLWGLAAVYFILTALSARLRSGGLRHG
jgi:ABC-2 type transport system permease protein